MKQQLMVGLLTSTALVSARAQAGIVSTSGAIEIVPAPVDVRDGTFESDTRIVVFAERQNIVLTSGLNVNVSTPGTSPASSSDDNLSPATIPAGTAISSFFLHCDAVGMQSPALSLAGSVTFDTEVLGLVFLNPRLNQGHDYPGLPSTLYSTTGAMEINSTPAFDTISLSADRRTVTVDFRNSNAPDDVRIITAAVPEPATWLLILCGIPLAWRRMSPGQTGAKPSPAST